MHVKTLNDSYGASEWVNMTDPMEFNLEDVAMGVADVFGKSVVAQSGPSLINATSCLHADVQAAIDSATHGDTVLVPAGNCQWGTNTLDITKGICSPLTVYCRN